MAALGVDGHHDALGTVFVGRVADHLRVGDGRGIETGLVRAGVEQAAHVFHGANPATHRERNEHLRGHRLDDVQDQVAPVAGGGDVQKRELVRTLLVVTGCDLHRIARVAQFDEVDPLDHAATGHVETGNDAFGEHGLLVQPFRSSASFCAASKSRSPL
ncbi:hypothetical protein D9M69_597690 [compost metagenome]